MWSDSLFVASRQEDTAEVLVAEGPLRVELFADRLATGNYSSVRPRGKDAEAASVKKSLSPVTITSTAPEIAASRMGWSSASRIWTPGVPSGSSS